MKQFLAKYTNVELKYLEKCFSSTAPDTSLLGLVETVEEELEEQKEEQKKEEEEEQALEEEVETVEEELEDQNNNKMWSDNLKSHETWSEDQNNTKMWSEDQKTTKCGPRIRKPRKHEMQNWRISREITMKCVFGIFT